VKDITKIRDLRFGKLSRNVGSVSSEGKKISTSKQDKLQNLGENGIGIHDEQLLTEKKEIGEQIKIHERALYII